MPKVGKNTSVKAALKNDIDRSNFREVAQDTIKKYFDRTMIIDGMLWGRLVSLYESILMRPQPMQPIVLGIPGAGSADGRPRFKPNAIVKRLFETGKLDLNDISQWDVPLADKEQFWQLLGYSVDGFGDLSWPSQDTKDSADIEAARLALKAKEKGNGTHTT